MNNKKKYTIAEQFAALKIYYPEYEVRLEKNRVFCIGHLRPTPRSVVYTFKISYKVGTRPKVTIINPILKRNFKNENIPHVYPFNELCLYYPNYQEFNSEKLISDCIIPWISLWLYHYENWHITGDWKGGGIHPNPKAI